jgi:hypothetical protein
MKYFTPIQKISLGVLVRDRDRACNRGVYYGGQLIRHDPSATPQVVVIELANTPSPSPVPIPLLEERQDAFATASADRNAHCGRFPHLRAQLHPRQGNRPQNPP